MSAYKKATLRPRKVAIHQYLQHLKYKTNWFVFIAWTLPVVLVLVAHAAKAVQL